MLLEDMSAAYSVEQERRSKFSSFTRQKSIRVASDKDDEHKREKVGLNRKKTVKPNPIVMKIIVNIDYSFTHIFTPYSC